MQDKSKMCFIPADVEVVKVIDDVLCGSGIMGKPDSFGENFDDGEVHG